MKYLVASANNYGNVGDDICGYSAKYLIERIDPNAEVVVTSPPFNDQLAEAADVFVLGGGGIFYDLDRANVDNYLSYLEYAQQHNKPNVVLGVGVQGINTEWGKNRYREVLNKCDLVTVRSPRDKELLDEIGIKNVITTQDLGFVADEWVKKAPLHTIRDLAHKMKKHKPRLGLAVVDLYAIKSDGFDEISQNFIDALEGNLPKLCENFDVKLLVHSRDDKRWYEALNEKGNLEIINYKTIADFPRFWEEYNRLDLVIGVRFHSIILGLLANKPVVAISSQDSKQDRLARYSMPTLKAQSMYFSDLAAVKDLFGNIYENYQAGAYKTATNEEISKVKAETLSNADLLAKTLKAKL